MRILSTICVLLTCMGTTACAGDFNPISRARYLIVELGSEDFDIREEATAELIRLGPPIVAVVRRMAQTTDDLEVRTRCLRIAKLAPLASHTIDELRRVLASTLVEITWHAKTCDEFDAVAAVNQVDRIIAKIDRLALAKFDHETPTHIRLEALRTFSQNIWPEGGRDGTTMWPDLPYPLDRSDFWLNHSHRMYEAGMDYADSLSVKHPKEAEKLAKYFNKIDLGEPIFHGW